MTCVEGLYIRWGGPVKDSFCCFLFCLLLSRLISSWETLEYKVKYDEGPMGDLLKKQGFGHIQIRELYLKAVLITQVFCG